MTPLVSIVTISRNDHSGLRQTYQSVCEQNFESYEWIIVDGASNDATLSFLQDIPSSVGSWTSEPDGGIFDAMNKGIRRSKGAYCIFMNSGDVFAAPTTISTISKFLDNENQIVYGDAIEVFDDHEAYKGAFPAERYWYSMFTHHQAIFYRRDNLARGYDTTFRLAGDWALTSGLLMAGAKARHVPQPICRFRRGGSSDNAKLRTLADEELWRVYRDVHKHNMLVAISLYSLKRAANLLRFYAKPLYNIIRMRTARSERS